MELSGKVAARPTPGKAYRSPKRTPGNWLRTAALRSNRATEPEHNTSGYGCASHSPKKFSLVGRGLAPQFLGSNRRAFRQGFHLHPAESRIHRSEPGERAEAAIRARNNSLPADDIGVI